MNFKVLKSLLDKKGRLEHGLFILEGEKVIRENLDRVKQIYVREDKSVFFPLEVITLSPSKFNEISSLDNPSGVLGVFKIERNKLQGKTLVLDRIQDPGNMGTILRTAVAFGWTKIITLDCVDVYSPKVLRAVSGQIFKLDIQDLCIGELSGLNLNLIVADCKGNQMSYIKDESCALVLGNEGSGVRPEIQKIAKSKVTIPMENDTESLNVAIAGGILMWYYR